MRKIILLTLFLGFGFNAFAQQLEGTVVDKNNDPIPGANVFVKETQQGTTTDFDGKFVIDIKEFPATIEVSYIGYKIYTKTLNGPQTLKIVLEENNEFLDDVVVTASRGREKIKESPVSIERMSLKEIRRNAAPSFYDALNNLKGVDLNTNSLTFQSVNTRGFATFSNNRFLQLIDGMDNTSPALNFPLGNLIGINELDVQSVEILPGAASALYGANAFNGVLNMRSKNPFNYKGFSDYVKYGVTSQSAAGTNTYSDAGIRYAWGGDYAAAKINFSLLEGTDWYAVDETDIDMNPFNASVKGSRTSNPSYDGMNIYGDEIASTFDMNHIFDGTPLAMLNRNEVVRVSRTGYAEKDLTDYKAKSLKFDFGFHYRPSGQPGKLEFIWNSRFGTGKTIYQGTNRYVLDGIFIHQHKLEVKNKNWFVRAYYTGEDAGHSYDTKFTAWNINRRWLSDKDWFTFYLARYSLARSGIMFDDASGYPVIVNGVPVIDPHGPYSEAEAHQIAREFADYGNMAMGQPKPTRLIPGTKEFDQAFEDVTNDPDFRTGGKFIDNTNLKHIEANYNFKDLVDFAEIQVGGSLRRFSLHSEGTIFTDYPGLSPINIDESAAYVQITKKILDNKLKLATSLRYDKQRNFDGNFSPRFSAVYSAGENKEHNFRISYQTGFRNPTTQELYIGLNLGPITLVGGAPDNWDRYKEDVIAEDPVTHSEFQATITGRDAYTNSYTLTSFMKFAQTGNPADLEVVKIGKPKPEQVSTIEFGYRGSLIKNLSLDMAVYYNSYNNFGAGTRAMALSSEVGTVDNFNNALPAIAAKAYKPFQLYTNAKSKVTSYGADFGFNYKAGDYLIGLIYDYAKFDYTPAEGEEDFRAGFNTPEHRVKVSLANDNLYKNLGFKIDYKYQSEFLWQATFADGMVPARSVLDAQVTYNFKKYKTKIRLGVSNILGKEYLPAPGTGKVGSIYYIGMIYGN